MAALIVSALAKWNGKALTGAGKQISAFDKTVSKLGKTFLSVFAARKLYQFGKQSVAAFAADEKAARSLALQLKNTGNEFQMANVENFIAMLQRTRGVLDDELRPAFRTLLTATGDVAKSQQALNLALDISSGTGKDLSAVSMALAKGFGGQTTALSRLGAGLDKATLASGDMDKITAMLTAKFKGQSLEAVKGYAGQIALLGVATQNTKELIGKGLLDALKTAAGDEGVTNIAVQMERAAAAVADMIRGLGVISEKLQAPAFFGVLGKVIDVLSGGTFSNLQKIGQKDRFAKAGPKTSTTLAQFAAQVKTTTGTVKKLNTVDSAALLIKQQSAALDVLKAKFDTERIGLYAALAAATDDETKARILAKIAIVESNGAAAIAINKLDAAATAAASSTSTMTASQINFANSMSAYLSSLLGSGRSTQDPGSSSLPVPIPTNMPSSAPAYSYTGPDLGAILGSGRGTDMGSYGTPINIALNLDGKQIAAVTTTAQEAQSQNGGSSGSWSSARYM